MHVLHELQLKEVPSPILASSNTRSKYLLDTDACNMQVGRVLLQELLDCTTNPVGYW